MTIVYEVGNGLYVNITNRCTNKCGFCVRNVADGFYGELWLEREPTVDEVVEAVCASEPTRYSELVFCGYGEPTVRFYDMILIASRLKGLYPGLRIRLNTNGHADLIFGKDVTPLLRGVIDEVSVSLNAVGAAEYVRLCAPCFGDAAYEGMLEFARRAKERGCDVAFSVVAGSIPDEDIEKCREIAANCGVKLKVRDMIRTSGE